MNLLTVDWDYFFRCPDAGKADDWEFYDWGHNEAWSASMLDVMWQTRATAFMVDGRPLPLTTGDEQGFWQRFRIAPDAKLFYSDSHMYAVDATVRAGVDRVLLFDAHHDAGYVPGAAERVAETDTVDCGNWMIGYSLAGAKLEVRYPRWRSWVFDANSAEPKPAVPVRRKLDDGKPVSLKIDRVHVCRSGSWTPPWLDEAFEEFIAEAPVAERVRMADYEDREFHSVGVAAEADALRRRLDAWRAETRLVGRIGETIIGA